MGDVLAGRRRGFADALLFAGPAVIASIAYMDPGNFATNIQAGARYGYALLWVVVLANLIAMLFQALSAKLGIVTGTQPRGNVPRAFSEAGRHRHVDRERDRSDGDRSRRISRRRDRALRSCCICRFIVGMGITAIVTYAILLVEKKGFRPMEIIIGTLVATIALCYVVEMFIAPVAWGAAAFHSVVPIPARRRGADDRGRHHRRDGDAACDLSAFGPDAEPRAGTKATMRAASSCVFPTSKSSSRSRSPVSSIWRW